MQDLLHRTLLLADMWLKRMFPSWALGIRPREEGMQWWQLDGSGITWKVDPSSPASHADHVEMSGFEVSAIISYGVDRRGKLRLFRHIVWPRLRTWPNNTHASFSYNFIGLQNPRITANRRVLRCDRPDAFHFDGMLAIEGTEKGIGWKRSLFPDPDGPRFCERLEFKNISNSPITLQIEYSDSDHKVRRKKERGSHFIIRRRFDFNPLHTLEPGAEYPLDQFFSACDPDHPELPSTGKNIGAYNDRRLLIERINDNLMLETGDAELNQAFSMANLRASESIFRTKRGLMHGPGGGDYYAALWTNDQCEYVNPYFAWSGYEPGLEEAMNCYRLYVALMDPFGSQPVPTSIVAEGDDIWNGAGDRGDAAMYAQGAGRFLLASGRREWAEELLPAIDWCLEWCEHQRLNGSGPVASDSDELEGRFSSGKANLCTSVLYYDALVSRGWLARALGDAKGAETYHKSAACLRKVIDDYFGAEVEGFDTYQYYDGCSVLRAWICLPLTVGLNERASGTLAALFSPNLWTPNGLRTTSDHETVWDRSTLFALRGAFCAGAADEAWQKLKEYSHHRLLGAHVPYPSEAFPEGNRRHLSAESGLYCRIFIEGMFGLRPVGLRSFDCTPHLPASLPAVSLRRIAAFCAMDASGKGLLDLEVERAGTDHLQLRASINGSPFFEKKIKEGETARVVIPEVFK